MLPSKARGKACLSRVLTSIPIQLFFQAIQRTRVLLLQQGANRVLVNVLDELFTDGFELNDIETDFAVEVL